MRAKSLLLLIIALGCGTVASVGISQVMMEQKQGPTEAPTVEIFVAVKDIDVNTKLSPELFKLEKWPQNRVPDGAIFRVEDIKDRFVRQRMYPGEPISAASSTIRSSASTPRSPRATAFSTCPSTNAMVVVATSSPVPE